MKRTRVGLTCLAVALAFAAPAIACSTFLLRAEGGPVFGRNTDALPMPGLLIVNKRGISKRAISWGVIGPGDPTQPTATWTSRYGSVTATVIGRAFPDGGMNEAGLIVEEMTLLDSRFPRRAGRPTISQVQWLQYLLDTKATVQEVVDDVDRFDLTGWHWHFMVADKSGDCATIDFVEGRADITRGSLAGCVLTNDSAQRSAEHLATLSAGGAASAEPEGPSSLARYVRAVRRLNAYESRSAPDRIAFAFGVLSDVAQGPNTIRSFVHDPVEHRLYFRTHENRGVKYLDLDDLDFDPSSPALMLDIETLGIGDVRSMLQPYDKAVNRNVVGKFFEIVVHGVPIGVETLNKELADAGMSESQFLTRLADYPDAPDAVP